MRQYAFKYHYRTVDHYTEVDSAKAHQIGRNAEDSHHDKCKQHGKRNHRCHYQSRANVAQEDDQHQKHYQCTLYEVEYHSRDISVHEFRTVEIRLYGHALGQYLLHLCHALLKGLGHHIGIGAFQHHGYAAHALAFAIDGHRSEAFGRPEAHLAYVADVHRHTTAVGNHYFLDVLHLFYHSLRTDVVGFAHLLDVAGACVLIVLAQCFKHIAYGNLQRTQGIGVDGYLILLEIAAEAVYLHYAGYARELALHYPILYGAKLHGIIFVLVFFIHSEHILIYFAQTGGDRHQFGCAEFRWYFARHGLYLLIHQLSGLKRRHILLKHHCHQRKPEARHRTNLFHIHNVAHRYFHRHCD